MTKNKDYSYPDTDDENFQKKIYDKREFYYHKIPQRDVLKTKEEITEYRNDICGNDGDFIPREQQIILSNFLSPDTPYNGLLIMHGTGTGKTCTAISIAEQFKEQVKKYNTHIYVLVPGTNIKENFKKELLFCTGETYLKNKEVLKQLTLEERERERKVSIYSALQYYKILSYKTFYRKVLGEKISEKKIIGDDKIKTGYKKNEEGEIEREIVVDKISSLDNSLIIVDEAHNLSGNEYGEALRQLIKKSKNLKVLLLSATPMKNLADDIVDMINFIRPYDDQIKRDKVFTSEKNYMMKFKDGGIKYLKEMISGYVSFFRGNMPYTFAKRIDKGEIPDGLLFTPVIRCFMDTFQLNTYNKTADKLMDSLEKSSSAAANFVYPGLDSNGKLTGYYSTDGLNKVLSQLTSSKDKLIKEINKTLFKGKIKKEDLSSFIEETEMKNITGSILKLDYLEKFSVKFYKCISRLSKLVEGNKEPGTAFVYSNLVHAGGMEVFAEALKQNGYLEFKENKNEYIINNDTIDSRTGFTFSEFKKKKLNMNDFNPATFLLVTGSSEDGGDDVSEIKQKIIRTVFNNPANKDGKMLKIILGSRVMSEGVTLENVKEVHILDVHYNLGRVEQVIGRAIRMCKHQEVITDKNFFPEVNVYRYVVSLKNKLSTDEVLYQKAEKKYILVKKVERIIKEASIDCPLLLHGNKFPEELIKYKDCVEPTLENVKKGKKICPAICDFESCDFKCDDKDLNKFYDSKKGTYKDISINDIDYNTYNDTLAKSEINDVKNKIKDLYRFEHIYTYNQIMSKIKSSFRGQQSELFESFFLDRALDELMPKTENDYNNFKDTIYDKFNRSGYLIQRGKYFIFQPFDDNENLPLYYRQNYDINTSQVDFNNIPVKNYIKQKYGKVKDKKIKDQGENKIKVKSYDFDSVMDYYKNRDENFIVGVIDKAPKSLETEDVFKIRPQIKKSDLKRGTGIVSIKGAVCFNSKDKEYLINVIKKLRKLVPFELVIKEKGRIRREELCDEIKKGLIYLEKYSTTKDGNKKTYVMVPSNHPDYEFPLNLEDRIKFILRNVQENVNRKFDHKVIKEDKGMKYIIEINNNKMFNDNDMKQLGFKLEGKKWIKILK
jgi:ribosomal protein L19E